MPAVGTTIQPHGSAVFCHRCESEWPRNEHGLICPSCHSDFTEILEAESQSRQASGYRRHEHDPYAEDPDEQDIDDVRMRHNFEHVLHDHEHSDDAMTRAALNPDDHVWRNETTASSHQSLGQGLIQFIGSILPAGILGRNEVQHRHESLQPHDWELGRDSNENETNNDRFTFYNDGQPTARRFFGPGFNVTIATSTSGNLHPRNAHRPQAFQSQPDSIDQMMRQMFANMGVIAHGATHPAFATPFPQRDTGLANTPFEDMLQLLGFSGNLSGSLGDTVLSQEAMDRVVTQLMEQHQSGNAPGPALAVDIAALPKRSISEHDMDGEAHADCSICMDSVPLGAEVTELPCSHWFHSDCINAWLSEHNTCPHCRKGIRNDAGRVVSTQSPAQDLRRG